MIGSNTKYTNRISFFVGLAYFLVSSVCYIGTMLDLPNFSVIG
jgi:uncharacterized membrane protein YhhN